MTAVPSGVTLSDPVVAVLRAHLPSVSDHVIGVVMAEVPAYTDAWDRRMGQTIANAVRIALDGFFTLVTRGEDQVAPMSIAVDGAYALGRGEARSGRSMDALLAAYRVGARVSWHEMSALAVREGLPAADLARFAEVVFAYIDELSAASVAGHADELATSGRVRQRYLDHLARQLISGATDEVLVASAERADWAPPRTLTTVLVPSSQVRAVLALVDPRALQADVTLPGGEEGEYALVMVPDVDRSRSALLRSLKGRHAVVGPSRPWQQVRASYLRTVRGAMLFPPAPRTDDLAVDTEQHLAALVLASDVEAHDDLRARVLAPLADLRPATREKLEETLRAWVLHLGRRDAVAEALFVHAQTVRYRMGQIREAYGDKLDDPDWIRDLVVALA